MANINEVKGQLSATISGASSHKITNLSVPTANTEVSHALSSNLKQIIFKTRNKEELKFAFTATESGTNYVTLEGAAVANLDSLTFSSETLYVQSPSAGVTVEILELF